MLRSSQITKNIFTGSTPIAILTAVSIMAYNVGRNLMQSSGKGSSEDSQQLKDNLQQVMENMHGIVGLLKKTYDFSEAYPNGISLQDNDAVIESLVQQTKLSKDDVKKILKIADNELKNFSAEEINDILTNGIKKETEIGAKVIASLKNLKVENIDGIINQTNDMIISSSPLMALEEASKTIEMF